MILIADSGSTKTDWRLIDAEKKIHQYATQGLNPYFQTSEDVSNILETELIPQFESVTCNLQFAIYFYGAGCEANSKKEIIREALLIVFPSSTIEIYSDMIGAARATCGANPGIAAILGTGSNTCYYDGIKSVENVASLGYILGDEGSGAHIGKTFIQAYLNKEMPEHLSKRFYERTNLGLSEILDAVYKKPMPNRFLASFSKFIYQNLKEQFVIDLVANCFEQFFDKHVCKYNLTPHPSPLGEGELKLSCVGSVAFYYSNILRAVADKKGVQIETIIETPIAGLVLYHLTPHPSPFGEGEGVNRVGNLFKGASPIIFENAHKLRLENDTKPEQILWEVVRNRKIENCKFRRQHAIGNFIADFYCHERKLIIEVDGAYHDEKSQKERDEARTLIINEHLITVLRFTNDEVLNEIHSVIERITKVLNNGFTPLQVERGRG